MAKLRIKSTVKKTADIDDLIEQEVRNYFSWGVDQGMYKWDEDMEVKVKALINEIGNKIRALDAELQVR